MDEKNYEKFLHELGFVESSNRYNVENKYGYLGRYQMGERALKAAGYYDKSEQGLRGRQDWSGKFTGKDGVYSKKDFLNNPEAQENAIRAYHKDCWEKIKSAGMDKYVGSTIQGVKISQASLLAAYHNQGANSYKYFRTSGKEITRDGNSTPVNKYVNKFAEYDVSEVTVPKQTKVAKVEKNVTIQKESGSVKNKSGSENVQRRDGESRIDYFTRRIRESMEDRAARLRGEKKSSGAEDSAEKSAKPTLKEMMASQKDRLANIKERIFSRSLPLKRMHGDIPEGYQNKYLKDKKIFTKEQIDSMSPKEKKELQDAIKYQSDTIGIPDEKQAKKMSEKSGSGMIYVSGYTRSDGTEVRSYYRSR